MADLTSRIMVVISASSAGAVKELNDLKGAADRTGSQFDTIGKKAGLAGATIRTALVAGAGMLAGAGLVSFLQDSVDAFAESQKAADLFAKAMNTSGENAGKLSTYLNTLGIDTNDLIEINAEFGKALKTNGDALDGMGVSLKKNADGSVDTADAFVQVVDGLKGIKDGSERSQVALKFFGEEGTKQLAPLIFGSKNLKDTLEDLQFVYDPKRAQEYAAAQQDLDLAFMTLQRTIGQALIPAFTDAARAATDVINFLGEIPVQTYLVVGGFVALKGATSFLGPAFSSALSAAATGVTGLGAAAEAAGGKAGLVKTGFGNVVKAIGPWNIAMAGLAAGITAIGIGAENAKDRLQEFAADLDETQGSVQRNAQAMLDSSSAWERFWVTLTNNDDALNPGTWTKILNEALAAAFSTATTDAEAYEAALRKTKDEMGSAAAAAVDYQAQQKTLNDAVASFIDQDPAVTWQNIADAAGDANVATLEQKQAANLAEIAMGMYAVSIQGVVDWQTRLADSAAGAESKLGDLQDTLGEVGKIVDNPETWENEVVLNTAQAKADLYEYVGVLANSGLTAEQIIPLLVDLQNRDGTSTEADAIIQGVIDSITGKSNEVPPIDVQTALDPSSTATTQAGIDALAAPKTTDVTVNTTYGPGGYDAVKARKDFLVAPETGTLSIDTGFSPDGYNAVKARKDFLLQAGTTTLDIGTNFSPDGYNALKMRKDYLAQNVAATVTNNVLFAPDGYLALKARKDYLSQNRTATITINQVTGTKVAAGGGEDEEGRPRRIPNLYASVQPTNIFKVAIDGQPLRAWIRSEVAAAQPARAGVA